MSAPIPVLVAKTALCLLYVNMSESSSLANLRKTTRFRENWRVQHIKEDLLFQINKVLPLIKINRRQDSNFVSRAKIQTIAVADHFSSNFLPLRKGVKNYGKKVKKLNYIVARFWVFVLLRIWLVSIVVSNSQKSERPKCVVLIAFFASFFLPISSLHNISSSCLHASCVVIEKS